MLAKYEKRNELYKDKIWLSKWLNLKNLPHWHDEVELVYSEKGNCYIDIEEKLITLSTNDSAFIEGGKIHKIDSDENSIIITIHIDNDLIKKITTNKSLESEKLKGKYNFDGFYKYIKKELNLKQPYYNTIIENCIQFFIATIFRNEKNIINDTPHKSLNTRYELLKAITKEIELNYQYTNLDELSKKFGYSTSHFSRMFSSLTGTTLTKYINAIKIEKAVELIEDDNKHTITEIASITGFSSIRNFNRTFLSLTGHSPSTLSKDYTFSRYSKEFYNEEYNPTLKQSIKLD